VRPLVDYHHFRADAVRVDDRVARCEEHVVQLLLKSQLTEAQRDSSVVFELKHHHSTAQFARVLARQRGLPVDACTVGALLHDVYVMTEGRYADHAHLGAPIALKIMDELGGFSADEHSMVERIVFHHSDKHLRSADPFVEFGKDADVLDCFLYPGAFGFYLRHKPLAVFSHYLDRAKNVWRQVGMPEDVRFSILDTYADGWMDTRSDFVTERASSAISGLLCRSGPVPPPPFLLAIQAAGSIVIALNTMSWEAHLEAHANFGKSSRLSVQQAMGLEAAQRPDADTNEANTKVLLEAARSTGMPVIVWPALDAYEALEDVTRVTELGLDPEELMHAPGNQDRPRTSDRQSSVRDEGT
jgi:hypothetical protein